MQIDVGMAMVLSSSGLTDISESEILTHKKWVIWLKMVVNFPFSNNENEKYFTVTGGHNEIVEDNCLDSKLQVFHDSLFMSHIIWVIYHYLFSRKVLNHQQMWPWVGQKQFTERSLSMQIMMVRIINLTFVLKICHVVDPVISLRNGFKHFQSYWQFMCSNEFEDKGYAT